MNDGPEIFALFGLAFLLGIGCGAALANRGAGMLGEDCKSDGTCTGSLVCAREVRRDAWGMVKHDAPTSYRCDLPPR